ncbi:MAG: hypothetical protein K0R67_930 [Paenibacillus sp.]|nr:hypothetical protein [Paenibacillus sp.]
MDSEKRKLIVREIEHWRRSKLLPEHYCDFLLNLYMDETIEREKKVGGVSVQAIQNSRWYVWLLIFGSITAFCFLALHFNSFPIPLQIALLGVAVLGCYAFGLGVRRKQPLLAHMLVGLGSVALLGAGVLLMELYGGQEDAVLLMAYVSFCSLMWIVIGGVGKMNLFQFCGWVGLLLVYAYLLQTRGLAPTWLNAQLSWLPFCVLFGWLGWLLQRRKISSGAVMLVISFILLLMPEIYGFYRAGSIDPWFQGSLFVKLVTAGIILFGTRKKWIEWVA